MQATNQQVCSNFQDQVIGTGMAELFDQYIAGDTAAVGPAKLNGPIEHYKPVDPGDSSTDVRTAIKRFNDATKAYYAVTDPDYDDLKTFAAQYKSTVAACQSFTAAKPATFSITCKVGDQYNVPFATYQEAWAGKSDHCDATRASGTEYSDLQRNAVATAYGNSDDMKPLKTLYALCAQTGGYPINIQTNLNGRLSDSQVHEANGVLVLCPDHPQAATIQANIDAAGAAVAASSSQAQAVADGAYVNPGSYLVGTEMQPGTWQSVGAKVTNCYWSITDANGNIIDNKFIDVAPQFTITVPADAAGFTATGCAFQRIGS